MAVTNFSHPRTGALTVLRHPLDCSITTDRNSAGVDGGALPIQSAKIATSCAHCGGRFGMVTHRWWGNKFCKRTCKDEYLRELALGRDKICRWFGFLPWGRFVNLHEQRPAGSPAAVVIAPVP
jgi:hypothetical protein